MNVSIWIHLVFDKPWKHSETLAKLYPITEHGGKARPRQAAPEVAKDMQNRPELNENYLEIIVMAQGFEKSVAFKYMCKTLKVHFIRSLIHLMLPAANTEEKQ